MKQIHTMLLEQMSLTEENLKKDGRYATEHLEFKPGIFDNLYTAEEINTKIRQIQSEKRNKLFYYIESSTFSINSQSPESICFQKNGTIIWEKRLQEKYYEVSCDLDKPCTLVSIDYGNENVIIRKSNNNIVFSEHSESDWNLPFVTYSTNDDGTISNGHTIIIGKNYNNFQIDYENGIFSVYHTSKNGKHTHFGYFVTDITNMTLDEYTASINALMSNLGFNIVFNPNKHLTFIKEIMGNTPVPATENALRELTDTPSKNSARKRKKN